MKTHWKKTMNPDYLGSWAIPENQDLIVKIVSVATESVKNTDGKEEECLVAKLEGQKPMILNVTNCKTISKVLGTSYIEDWAGQHIQIYAASVKAFGDVVEAIRVRNFRPQVKKPSISAERFSAMLQAIEAGTYTKEQAKAQYALSTDQLKQLK